MLLTIEKVEKLSKMIVETVLASDKQEEEIIQDVKELIAQAASVTMPMVDDWDLCQVVS